MARRNKGEEKAIARQRIGILLHQAQARVGGPDEDLADRYADLAIRISRRYQMGTPPGICRKCRSYRRHTNTRIRVHRGRVITTCQCGHIHRRPLHGP